MRCTIVLLAGLATAGCVGEGPIEGTDAVARVGTQELSVDRLATIMAADGNVPLAREFAERLAHLWVEYTLFTERGLGTATLDSTLVQRAMWPEINQALVDALHRTVVDSLIELGPAAVDSAYQAGDHRLVKQILVATNEQMTSQERAAAYDRAVEIRRRLAAGDSWEAMNALNEDPVTKAAGGYVGMVARGEMVPVFDSVAFSLEPGALSDVFQTSFGYHVLYRPTLAEAGDDFAAGVAEIAKSQATESYLAELVKTWEVSVRPNAPVLMREAAGSPLRARSRTDVIGRHREADFTVADFVRWLRVLPLATQQQVAAANDDALREMATSMIRNEALVIEARRHDIHVTEQVFADIRARLEADVAMVRQALATDSGPVPAGVTAERYVRKLISDLEASVVVPVFLADALRQDGQWTVSERALDAVVDRAEVVRTRLAAQRGSRPVLPVNDSSR